MYEPKADGNQPSPAQQQHSTAKANAYRNNDIEDSIPF
jgi:hypothetical protein